jgi:hypothetical protein
MVGPLLQGRIVSMEQQARWLGRQNKTHYSPLRHLHVPESLQSVALSEVVRFLDLPMFGRVADPGSLCGFLGLLSKKS